MSPRTVAAQVGLAFLGTWYSWGGDDPSGFDCSGLVIECLKSAGKFPRGGDATAQQLYDRYKKVDHAQVGCLAFWGSGPDRIVHVELCIDDKFTVGASGGGSNTKTRDDAIRDNAFVKVRPIQRQRHFVGYVDPFIE